MQWFDLNNLGKVERLLVLWWVLSPSRFPLSPLSIDHEVRYPCTNNCRQTTTKQDSSERLSDQLSHMIE
jgi:hypothetical protein